MSADSYIHRSHEAGPGSALLFLFHGTGGDEHQFFDLGRHMLPEAGLVSPRGDVSERGAARFFRRLAEGHYDRDDLRLRTETMAGFIEAKVDAAKPAHVFGLGYSNGANILASVLMAKPALFGAAVLMHPLIPFEPDAGPDFSGRRILVTAGRADPICPASLTERLVVHLRGRGADVALDWHSGGHEIRPSEIDAATAFLRAAAAVSPL